MAKQIPLHTDTELLRLINSSDPKGLEILFKTYHKQLWLFANQILKDADAAEDTIQDVFSKIWEKRLTLQINTSLKAYLYTAVKNNALNKIKSNAKNSWLDEDVEEYNYLTTYNGENFTEAKTLQQKITLAVDNLPPKCSLIFKMSRFEEMSYKEIAESLQLSVKTIENQMGKALSLLRNQLKDYLTIFILFFSNIQ